QPATSPSGCRLFVIASRRRHTTSKRDWSSDVCTSDPLDDVCISCGLCVSKCTYDNMYSAKDFVEELIYRNLKNDVLKTTSFLRSKLSDKFEVLTEVKADGNARNKRVDIVINFTNKIYLIKV